MHFRRAGSRWTLGGRYLKRAGGRAGGQIACEAGGGTDYCEAGERTGGRTASQTGGRAGGRTDGPTLWSTQSCCCWCCLPEPKTGNSIRPRRDTPALFRSHSLTEGSKFFSCNFEIRLNFSSARSDDGQEKHGEDLSISRTALLLI